MMMMLFMSYNHAVTHQRLVAIDGNYSRLHDFTTKPFFSILWRLSTKGLARIPRLYNYSEPCLEPRIVEIVILSLKINHQWSILFTGNQHHLRKRFAFGCCMGVCF